MQTLVGRALSGVVIFVLFADAVVNCFAPHLIQAEIEGTGFSINQAPALGGIMAVCALLYAIPRTAVPGAILITGFLGGAITAHFRLGEFVSPPQIISLLLGVATWAGLYLRNERVRMLFA